MASYEDDLALSRRIVEGDGVAFTALVDRIHRPLMRLAEAFVGRGGTAEEIVQEAWVAVIDGLERFEGRSSLQTWIGSIVVNRARTRRAKDAREIPVSFDLDDDGIDPNRFSGRGFWTSPPQWDPAPDELVERRQAREAILAEIEKLPEGARAVITLRDIDEWTSEEVCNVLGLTETNQRVILHRARSKLRMALERRARSGARRG
jgi:RNA polymerase sigma-70 factor (ECF subfamily)